MHFFKRQHILRLEQAALVRMHAVVERCRQVGGEVLPRDGNAVQRARRPCRTAPLEIEVTAVLARVVIIHARAIIRARIFAAAEEPDAVVICGIVAAILAVIQLQLFVKAGVVPGVGIENRRLRRAPVVFHRRRRCRRGNCRRRYQPRKQAKHDKYGECPSCICLHELISRCRVAPSDRPPPQGNGASAYVVCYMLSFLLRSFFSPCGARAAPQALPRHPLPHPPASSPPSVLQWRRGQG